MKAIHFGGLFSVALSIGAQLMFLFLLQIFSGVVGHFFFDAL